VLQSLAQGVADGVGTAAGRLTHPLVTQANRALDRLVPAVVEAVASRVDVTDLIARHLDINALAETIDLNALAARLDLVGLANYVIDGVDLAALIRQSSASVSNEAVRGIRLQAAEADQTVGRVIDRLVRRHDRRIEPSVNGAGTD
jgi:hypothetical protein